MYSDVNTSELDDFIFGLESYMIADFEIGMEGKIGDAFNAAKTAANTAKTAVGDFFAYIGKKIREAAGAVLKFIKHPVTTSKELYATGKARHQAKAEERAIKKTVKYLEKAGKKKKLSKRDVKKITELASVNYSALLSEINDYAGDSQSTFDGLYSMLYNVTKSLDESDNDQPASQADLKAMIPLLEKLEKFGGQIESTKVDDDQQVSQKKRSVLTMISGLLAKIHIRSKNTVTESDSTGDDSVQPEG